MVTNLRPALPQENYGISKLTQLDIGAQLVTRLSLQTKSHSAKIAHKNHAERKRFE